MKECEEGLNNQVNLELYASYMYMGMGHFFDRDDVALKNVAKYFLQCAEEEREHANKFVKFHNQRGGTTSYFQIKPPGAFDPASFTVLKAMQCALALEVNVNKSLLALHETANGDPEFQDFIEANFLHEQVEAIKTLKDYITNLKRVGTGLGEYMFDKHFLEA
uniref:Ferritin n=1 Tax=Phallusia mammillata TaxID=59560 RepID=A0A6F9DDX3_9ASCI|nr:soma ferritin [Phallusia mammillata]